MYASVQTGFRAFTEKLEGRVTFMYLDVTGLVTIGYGNLIDPVGEALALPFERKDALGLAATSAEISAEWLRVKSHTELKLHGGKAFGAVTELQVTEATLQNLMNEKLARFELVLRETFAAYDRWPADAQLGLLSMAWAMGPAFGPRWPHFVASCNAEAFGDAADQCRMDATANPGLRPRNAANAVLFRNAAAVMSAGIAPDVLHYPADLSTAGEMRRVVVGI